MQSAAWLREIETRPLIDGSLMENQSHNQEEKKKETLSVKQLTALVGVVEVRKDILLA